MGMEAIRLTSLAPDFSPPHKMAESKTVTGIVTGQGRHGNALKAVAAGKTVGKAVLHAHDLGGAAEACQSAADEQGDEHHALGIDAGGFSAGRVAAHEMEAIAQPGTVEQEPDHGHQSHADQNGSGEIMSLHELADTGLLRQGGRSGRCPGHPQTRC